MLLPLFAIALSVDPSPDERTSPPREAGVFERCDAEVVARLDTGEERRTFRFTGDAETSLFGVSNALAYFPRPKPLDNVSLFATSSSFFGSMFASALVIGYYDELGTVQVTSRGKCLTSDRVVFSRQGLPDGTPIRVRLSIVTHFEAGVSWSVPLPQPHRIVAMTAINSPLFSGVLDASAAFDSGENTVSLARLSTVVPAVTGRTYVIDRILQTNLPVMELPPVRFGIAISTFKSRMQIEPLEPDVTIASELGFSYTPCPGDFDQNWYVDDLDFLFFNHAFDLGNCAATPMPTGCPADLNFDNTVDDADFLLFSAGYDAFQCP